MTNERSAVYRRTTKRSGRGRAFRAARQLAPIPNARHLPTSLRAEGEAIFKRLATRLQNVVALRGLGSFGESLFIFCFVKEFFDYLIQLEKENQPLFWITAIALPILMILISVVLKIQYSNSQPKPEPDLETEPELPPIPTGGNADDADKPTGARGTVVGTGTDEQPVDTVPENEPDYSIPPIDDLLYVNYSSKLSEQVNLYPVFRYPKKGCIVRSFSIGRSKRRGYKEEAFQKRIEELFGDQFEVFGNLRLNTGDTTKPYEPDIALISKTNPSLRIDVEIDEPYSGVTRQATHCKGDDVWRDLYFTDRGWVVIRFSEYQVHHFEYGCLFSLAAFFLSLSPTFKPSLAFAQAKPVGAHSMWDLLQAQKWERKNWIDASGKERRGWREEYLNHEFQPDHEVEPIDETRLTEKEKREEKEVEVSFFRKPKPFDESRLPAAIRNVHERDDRIYFDPEPHVYLIDGVPASSVTTVVSRFFPEFDPDEAIRKMRNGTNWGPHHQFWNKSDEEIKTHWKNQGMASARSGSNLHEQIENYYLGHEFHRTEEFHLFEQFAMKHPKIEPFRTEWRIFNEDHHIAGTIDLLAVSDSGYVMYDWKRSNKVVSSDGTPILIDRWGKKGLGRLSETYDTPFNRYCLQQSIYKHILESKYGLKISEMFIVVLHPEAGYHKLPVPYLEEETTYILNNLSKN